MKVFIHSTPHDLWKAVLQEAESLCQTSLQKDLELYLILLLMRYMNKPELVSQRIAPQLLQGLQSTPHSRDILLQHVGDACLLLSGLFPGVAENRLVTIRYFIQLGQGAYWMISKTSSDIYSALAKQFVPIMDVLQSIRQYTKEFPDLLPLQAYELWDESGSQRALRILQRYTQSTPMKCRK